jgi:hypothetical protein
LAGGFAGVQKQRGSVVLGLEADVDGADTNGRTTATNSQTCVNCRSGDWFWLMVIEWMSASAGRIINC